jgi:predicted HTH domain antitoxin
VAHKLPPLTDEQKTAVIQAYRDENLSISYAARLCGVSRVLAAEAIADAGITVTPYGRGRKRKPYQPQTAEHLANRSAAITEVWARRPPEERARLARKSADGAARNPKVIARRAEYAARREASKARVKAQHDALHAEWQLIISEYEAHPRESRYEFALRYAEETGMTWRRVYRVLQKAYERGEITRMPQSADPKPGQHQPDGWQPPPKPPKPPKPEIPRGPHKRHEYPADNDKHFGRLLAAKARDGDWTGRRLHSSAAHRLLAHGFWYPEELTVVSAEELRVIPYFGQASLGLVRELLRERGLCLRGEGGA